MTVAQMKKLYGGQGVAIVCPASKNDRTGFVESWDLLRLVSDIDAVEKAIAYYEQEGFVNVVPISMSEDIEIEGDLAAKYFRVFFDQNYLARFVIFMG